MKEKRWVVDTTLRDGEQQAKIAMNPRDKLEIALLLDAIHIHEIEVGIPSMGMGEKEYIQELMKHKKFSKISVWSRAKKEDIKYSTSCKPDIIHIGTPVSYVQIYTKLKKNKVWVERNLRECIDAAREEGVAVTVGFEDASRADIGYMIHMAKVAKEMGVNLIRIADTVGVLTPSRTGAIIREIRSQVDIDLEIHVHNDLGMAVANSIDGIKAGANYVDCTLGGMGERSGNCNLYEFVQVAERFYDLGIDKRKVKAVEKRLMTILQGKEGEKGESTNSTISR